MSSEGSIEHLHPLTGNTPYKYEFNVSIQILFYKYFCDVRPYVLNPTCTIE